MLVRETGISCVRWILMGGLSIGLAGCGGLGGGCPGVEVTQQYDDFYDMIEVTLVNETNEPRLVTLSSIGEDGSEVSSNPVRVDAHARRTSRVDRPRARGIASVEVTGCQ